ncbi:MAG: ubiquinone/menaquinone biosynthesis methyltransferase, partial [Thermodesulfobacteriota bacterium]
MKKTGSTQKDAQHAPAIQAMFDAIAPRYDFLNRFLSLRRDVYWRKCLVAAAIPAGSSARNLLDVACGTGDVAIEAARQCPQSLSVWGADFSLAMLAEGKKKTAPWSDRVCLLAADAFALPFKKETFDAVTIAFGIRNIADKPAVLEVFCRHLKKKGVLAVLELTTPQKGFLRSLYLFYFKWVLPLIGWVVSKNM